MYPIPGISVLLAAVSFVLVMLTIFAGNKPGFMEDYHVLYVTGDVSSALSDIENDLADELAKKLGIKEFYSIHLVDLCDGDFEPNATNPDATFNVTNCTTAFDYNMLNISALLDHELNVGPLSLNLADLGFTKGIQEKLDDIPKVIKAIVSMYIIAALCIGLTFFTSIGAVLLIPKSGKIIVLANLGLAGLAVLFLLIGNLITTVGSNKVVEAVTSLGNGIGLYAQQGGKFIAITWATFALMLLSVFYWAYEFFAQKKRGSAQHNRAIGGSSLREKNVTEESFSRSSSGLASLASRDSFPQQASGFPPTHAPGMPVNPPMDEVPLGDYNYRTGAYGPPPVSPYRQTPAYAASAHGSLAIALQDPVPHGILNPAQHHQQQPQQQQPQLPHTGAPEGHYPSIDNHGSSASPQSQQAPTPAASATSAQSKKNTRIPRACDLCSTRKVKVRYFSECLLSTSGSPTRHALKLTSIWSSAKEGLLHVGLAESLTAAQAAREAEKRRRLESDGASETTTPTHQKAAQALVSLGAPDTPTVMDAELCIAPLGVLRLFVDDFYTYIHPLVPFPHEPTFREAFENREDRRNPEFLALLAGMISALVASFPRSARLHLKATHSYDKFPRSIMLVDRCMKIALDMRTSESMLRDNVTVNDAAISYFLCLATGYTMRWNQCRRFMEESLRFLREMGFHKRRPPPTSLSLNQDRLDDGPTDFITDEMGKRIYWTIYLGIRSMGQVGNSTRDIIMLPATPNAPYPDWPREVDDAYILPDRILPQPEGTVSVLTSFVKCIQIYQTMDDLVRIELLQGISACTWEQQKKCLHDSLVKVKSIEQYLPRVLRLDMSNTAPKNVPLAPPVQGSSNGTSAYQYVPPAYPNTQPNNDVRHLVAANGAEKRYLQNEIQKANTYASLLSTRSHYVERYLSLRDVHRNVKRAEQARAAEPSIIYRTASDTSSSLAAAAIRAVAERDEIDDMFLAEREEIVHNFFTVVTSIEQRNMEPNGGSLIGKIRQVAGTLLGDPVDRKGRYELQNEEYLRVFLEILTRLEKTGTGATPTPGGQASGIMTPDDEEQELRNWADLREQQQRMARAEFL
ncbi:hypothetical protein VSDG_06807 [Cytospora chrysosperma]|uniref:Xylanolytic transcriptional activator regulatory domain-containing protein n=1 Tax=Cytospora chrysosperma TaxID=252740 RepID=A0A423VRA4_CYTCH|nr:hypothetical protein VSDG_06807 [Valsa sordida]